ncbi:putative enoyl CoA hydratase [Gonapodya sp. JEL0774]|nr:putative enoyl CoA hydratase [Gonapodya sp. JEL0774]
MGERTKTYNVMRCIECGMKEERGLPVMRDHVPALHSEIVEQIKSDFERFEDFFVQTFVAANPSRILQHVASVSTWVKEIVHFRHTRLKTMAPPTPQFDGYPAYETLKVDRKEGYVLNVQLNRVAKLNAFMDISFVELSDCFRRIAVDPDTRAVVITSNAKVFTAGLDLNAQGSGFSLGQADPARRALQIVRGAARWQEPFNLIEECGKPVIAAVHGACIGAGLDFISACDVRFCSKDAFFSIKEVDIGIAADVGTLQRFPKIVGNDSLVRELALSARNFTAQEADKAGLVSRVLDTKEECWAAAFSLAQLIASKSPVAVLSTKFNLLYSRDHSVSDGLKFAGVWNSGFIQTKDTEEAIGAFLGKRKPVFGKL